MTNAGTAPRLQPGREGTATTAVEFHYTQTESFPALLNELRASLLISTYQANKLLVARAAGGGLSLYWCARSRDPWAWRWMRNG